MIRPAALALALTGVLAGLLVAVEARAADPRRGAPIGFDEVGATRETLARLRAGGYVLFLRHALTDTRQLDRLPDVDLGNCATQRPLSNGGRLVAAALGEAIRAAAIPVGELVASPYCRTRDTAALAFPGHPATLDPDLLDTANRPDSRKAPVLDRLRQLLSAPVTGPGNRVVVAHAANLMDLVGHFPRETTLVVFQPRPDGGFDYVASIPPGLWPGLLN